MHILLFESHVWNRLIQAFCWMFIHSAWQGLILTICTAFVIVLTKKQSPLLRYNIITVLFFSFLFGSFITFIYEYQVVTHNYILYNRGIIDVPSQSFIAFYQLQRLLSRAANYCSVHADIVVMSWFFIFLFKVGTMIRSLLYIRMIGSKKVAGPGIDWTNRISILSTKLGVKKQVRLLESSIIKIPVVAGYLKPVIFVPMGILTNLPIDQVEAVLLHELAHIRRNDYLINFLQNITEMVFFFNPALLWISALMKEERENCCDDIALYHTKNKRQFLEALISFKEFATSSSASYTIAFPGKRNLLLHRFKRIITNQNKTLVRSEKLFFLFSMVTCVVFFATVLSRGNRSEIEKTAVVAKTLAPLTYAHPQQDNTPKEKTKPHVERSARRKLLAVTTGNEKPIAAQKTEETLKQDFASYEAVRKEEQKDFLKESRQDAEDAMQTQLRKKEMETIAQKLYLERQLIEQKKMQSLQDAQDAFAHRMQAQMDLQSAEVAKSEAVRMKKQADIAAQGADQKRLASRYKE